MEDFNGRARELVFEGHSLSQIDKISFKEAFKVKFAVQKFQMATGLPDSLPF